MEATMEASTIKFKTIQFLNGTKYLSEKQVEDLCYVMCHNLGIEKVEANFVHVREACKIYFGDADLSFLFLIIFPIFTHHEKEEQRKVGQAAPRHWQAGLVREQSATQHTEAHLIARAGEGARHQVTQIALLVAAKR